MGLNLSVVIPCWNEAAGIGPAIERLRAGRPPALAEVIVVDGGSSDGTVAAARAGAQRVVELGRPNRGAQLHAGARAASGDYLLFLHADALLPEGWARCLERAWLGPRAGPAPAATAFSVDYGRRPAYRAVAMAQNLRTRWLQVAYGDQGLCVPAGTYARSGGFPEVPLMEDIELSRRLRALGRIELLPERIRPSPRALEARGPLFNSLRNRWIVLRWRLGADPHALWREYYPARLSGGRDLGVAG